MVSRLHQAGQGPSSRSRLQRDETAAGSQRLRELQQQQHIQTELEWQQSRQEQAQAAAQQAAGYMSRLGEVLAQYDAAYPAGEEAAGLSKEEQKQLSGQLSELMAQADGIESSLQKNAGWLDEEAVQTAQANLKSLLQAAESIPGEMAAYEQGAKDWQQALAYRDGHSLQADIVDPITYYRAGQQGLLGDWEGTSYSQYLQQAGEYMKSMAQTPAQSGEAGKWQEKRMQITSQAIAQQTRKITPDDLAQADAAVAEAEAIRNKQGEGYVVQREDGSQVSAWQNLREKREERDTLNQRYNQQQKGSPTRFDNMTPEQQQTYVFSPNSDYSQAMQQKLTAMQDSTQEEKLAYLEEQGYTWDEIQRLVMAMDPSDTQQDLLDYINENKRYSGMQAAVGNIAQEHPVLASIVSIPANVLGDAVSLAEQVGGLLTGNKVSRNSLGNVLTGAASAARQTVAEQIDNDALRFLYNAGMFAGDMALGAGVDKLGGRLLGRLGLSGLGSVDDSYRASRGLTGYGGDIEELAGRYSGSTRRAFLSGYDGGVDPQTYARGFDFYHGEGRLGMDFDQASSLADELGLGISKSSGFQAHASGVNEAAAKSLTGSVADDTIKSVISEADSKRLSKWRYRPSDDLYSKYKEVFDNPKYYDQNTGAIRWPGENGDPNINGFQNGEFQTETLQPGTIIDRYGDTKRGRFFSPYGTSLEARALPPQATQSPYTAYRVLKPFEVKSGQIAPWFDQPGEGIQYLSDLTVEELFMGGYIGKAD